MTAPFHHRIHLPAGAVPTVRVGDQVEQGGVLATALEAGTALRVPIARPIRRSRKEAAALVVVQPGTVVRVGQPLARAPGREVRSPRDAIFLAYVPPDGSAHLLPLQPDEPIRSEVRGIVMKVGARSVTIAVQAEVVTGVGGTGPAVHGPLTLLVDDPAAVLDPSAIAADMAGHILVGGSWASAEAITRARAVGVAAIVVAGLHARALADFRALQHRRSLLGTSAPPFAVLALDGFGRAAMDPDRFSWLQAHANQPATVLGDQRRLVIYDASPAPTRVPRAVVGDRVLIVGGPGRGQAGLLGELPTQPIAVGSGISALTGLVRLDAGRTVAVPLANLEAVPPAP